MSPLVIKSFAAGFIFLLALCCGLWPLLNKQPKQPGLREFPAGESFACGVFFGAGLLHMLPDANAAFRKAGYAYPFAFLIAAAVFLSLLLLEHLSVALQRHTHKLTAGIVLLTTLMLIIHSFLEGAAVGVSTETATTLIIMLAIIAHKGAASFALATSLSKSHLRFSSCLLAFFIFALMTPLGVVLGGWLTLVGQAQNLLVPVFTALAAGTFLYIGTLHGLDRASLIKNCCNLHEFFLMLTGFSLMAIVAIWT